MTGPAQCIIAFIVIAALILATALRLALKHG